MRAPAALCLMLAACAPAPLPEAEASEVEAVTAVYHCVGSRGEYPLVTRTVPAGLGIFLPPDLTGEAYQVLAPVAVDGGYANEKVQVIPGETEATLRIGGGPSLTCRYDRRASIWEHAKLNGVDFRGVGNEPGWVLEIREQTRLEFNYDYGTSQLDVPILDTATSDRQTRFTGRLGEDELVVTLVGEPCSDTMSDEIFPTRVDIGLGDRVFKGCGRPLH